jgi:hypothetical protein
MLIIWQKSLEPMSEVKGQIPEPIKQKIEQTAQQRYVPNVADQVEIRDFCRIYNMTFDELCQQCGYPVNLYPKLRDTYFFFYQPLTEDDFQVIQAFNSIRRSYSLDIVKAAVERQGFAYPETSNLKEVESRISNYAKTYPRVNIPKIIELVFPEIHVPTTGYVPPATYGVLVRGNTIVEVKSKFDTKMISKDGNNADLELTDKGSIRIYPASDPKAFIDKPLEKGALVYVRGSTILAIDVQARP